MQSHNRKGKTDVMDLEKHVDKRIRVKFAGGREGASLATRALSPRRRRPPSPLLTARL
jgi:hypothetical protein